MNATERVNSGLGTEEDLLAPHLALCFFFFESSAPSDEPRLPLRAIIVSTGAGSSTPAGFKNTGGDTGAACTVVPDRCSAIISEPTPELSKMACRADFDESLFFELGSRDFVIGRFATPCFIPRGFVTSVSDTEAAEAGAGSCNAVRTASTKQFELTSSSSLPFLKTRRPLIFLATEVDDSGSDVSCFENNGNRNGR